MKSINPQLAGCAREDTFAVRMRQARLHAGALTIKDAAAKIGLSAGHLARIERGGVDMVKEPRTIERAAFVYGVSSVWLYAGGHAGERLTPDWARVT